MANKLTQTKFIELMQRVTGHSKNFIKQNLRIQGMDSTMFVFDAGDFRYHSWTKNGKYIYTQTFLQGQCVLSFYHDLETLKINWDKYEEDQRKELEYQLESQ